MAIENPINKVVDEIKAAGMTDACLFWFAYKFINSKCKTAGDTCSSFPPSSSCDIPDCVHKFLVSEIGIDMPALAPKRTIKSGANVAPEIIDKIKE